MTRTTPKLARKGQAAVAVRARPRVVAFALTQQAPVLTLVVAVPAVAALIEGEIRLGCALLIPSVLLLWLAFAGRELDQQNELRRIEAVATLALIFVLSGLLAAPGFIMLGLSPLDALFEAISGITTTGLSVAREAEGWPISGHFLRAWLQWCGGVVVAVAGVALLMDAGRAARVIGRESVSGENFTASTRARARLILASYGTITAIGILISVPLFPGWWEGPMVVLAAVSTGGFSPRDTSLADYARPAQIFALTLCIATSLSLLFYAAVMKLGLRETLRRGTVPTTLAILACGTGLYALGHVLLFEWDGPALVSGLLNHVSAQTTAGFSVAPVMPTTPLFLLLIAAMILGGDVGSTTGGIKTARAAMLTRMVHLVFLRLRLPCRAVSHLKIGDKRADAEAILFAAALLSVYVVAMLLFWAALYAGGHAPLPALFDAVSALSGVGLSTGVIGPDLAGWLKTLTIFAMLLGRLEFFVLIALCLPSTWISNR